MANLNGRIPEDEVDRAAIRAGVIAMQLRHLNREAAHESVERYFVEERLLQGKVTLDSHPLELGLSVRVCNMLEEYRKVQTIRDLVELDPIAIESIPYMGPKQFAEIKEKVREFVERQHGVQGFGKAG